MQNLAERPDWIASMPEIDEAWQLVQRWVLVKQKVHMQGAAMQ